MRNLGAVVAILVVLGSVGYGAWQYAQDQGWVAGSPSSPRAENFKRALDQYLPHTRDPQKRACASIRFPPGKNSQAHFPDTQFWFTPPTYLARLGSEVTPLARERIELFTRHGYLQSQPGEAGTIEYTMTWKGYAASNGAGCMYLAGIERDVKVLSFRLARVDKSGDKIWEVLARPTPKRLEPWVSDPAFRESVKRDEETFRSVPDEAARKVFSAELDRFGAEIDPAPVYFELSRQKGGFRVLGEKAAAGQLVAAPGASDARPIAPVETARLRGLIEAYIEKGREGRGSYCLEIPGQGADEVRRDPPPVSGGVSVLASAAFYNLPERSGAALRPVLIAYEKMRRMESLGLATSELLAVGEFNRRVASGGIRYNLTPEAKAMLSKERGGCIRIGSLHLEEILQADQFSAAVPRPRFLARMRLRVQEGREALAEKFGHLARMQDPGFPVMGILQLAGAEMEVASLSYAFPEFLPDLEQIHLPIIEPSTRPAPTQAQPQRQERKEMKVPRTMMRPLRTGERVIRCGGDTIICDANDTVVCGGRVVPCR